MVIIRHTLLQQWGRAFFVSVVAELINANGGLQASATSQPGQTVRFTLNDASRRVKSTYHMANGQEYIVVDELSM